MRIVDLTHLISSHMPVYPGTQNPEITLSSTLDQEGYLERKLILYSHTGTHVDAPAHILSQAMTLDELPYDQFIGKGLVLDLTALEKDTIEITDLLPNQYLLQECDFALLHTGWSNLWGNPQYFKGYPVLSSEAAAWVTGFKLKGLGVDAISVDEPDSTFFPIHRILLGCGIIIIENLTNLRALHAANFIFSCFPLKIKKAEGSPVRAVGMIP